MTAMLEQPGIFKCRVVSWSVKEMESGAVAIALRLLVLSELSGGEWASWAQFDEHHVYGDFWIIKKDGGVNGATVEQLVDALGWDGDLRTVTGEPPDVVVQAQVKAEEYKGVTKYKAAWLNREDFVPTPQGETPEDVNKLHVRYGSLIRAAVGASKGKKSGPKPAAKPAPKPAPTPVTSPPSGEAPTTADGRPMVYNPISDAWEPETSGE